MFSPQSKSADFGHQAHPILKASWTIVSGLYEVNLLTKCLVNHYEHYLSIEQAVKETDIQNESIRELATTLREILGITKAIPNFQEIPDTISVIKEINGQSLEVAALIQKYTKLHFAGNSVPHLHEPAESNDALFVVRAFRIQADLKSRIEKCRDKWVGLKEKLSLRITVDTNIRVQRIEDRQLGIPELLFISRINENNSFDSPSG